MSTTEAASRTDRPPLAAAAVTTILPVRDLDRAKRFYIDTLGLAAVGTRPDGQFLLRAGDGSRVSLFHKPEGTKAEHTALSFAVDDLEAAIGKLGRRGVAFHDYDLPGFRTIGHICSQPGLRCAWFSDPEGNVLCLHQDMPA
jgi:catechol 2,3-dioxygenase-like lactoylglutathione lyase family enzyme